MKTGFILIDTEDNACRLRMAIGGRERYERMIAEGFCGYELNEIKTEADRLGINYTEDVTEETPAF